jgi:hypothetical protein
LQKYHDAARAKGDKEKAGRQGQKKRAAAYRKKIAATKDETDSRRR